MPAITFEDPLVKDFIEQMQESTGYLYKLRGESVVNRNISVGFRNQVEMGWANRIKLDHDFIGRDALEPIVQKPKRTMVTLLWNSEDVIEIYRSLFRKGTPFHHMEMPRELLFEMVIDRVIKDGKNVGISTSRCYSYYFREMISLCVLYVKLCTPGTDVTVIWGDPGEPQKQIRAKVASAPYKTEKRRIDVSDLPSYL